MAEPVKPTTPVTKPTAPKAVAKTTNDMPVNSSFRLPTVIDLAEFMAIYSSVRDGDYLGAAKRAARLLNEYLNPKENLTGVMFARQPEVLEGERLETFDKALDGLSDKLESLAVEHDEAGEGDKPTLLPQMTKGPNPPTEFGFMEAIQIVTIVVDLIKKLRERRSS